MKFTSGVVWVIDGTRARGLQTSRTGNPTTSIRSSSAKTLAFGLRIRTPVNGMRRAFFAERLFARGRERASDATVQPAKTLKNHPIG
jgi:hypothetical protein